MLSPQDLSRYAYFSGLSEAALKELAANLEEVSLSADTPIIRESTPADYFYFLKDGEVEITKRTRFGQNAKLTTLHGGTAFGEMALLSCSHRTCSVTTKTDAQLYRLSKQAFEDTVMAETTFRDKLLRRTACYNAFNRMKTCQSLALIEPEKLFVLAEKMQEMSCNPGDDIIIEGDRGDTYFIIKSGKVEVLKKQDETHQQLISTLKEGECFGEEALIRDQRRNATVRALTATTLLTLSKRDFDMTLKTSFLDYAFPEDIPLDNLTDFVFIDARIRPEYEEEHIEGAINIPLEELRQKYFELDPSQQYLTYCTNDSRGMVAAFLLSTQGFNAKNLRGGLSGWEGPLAVGSDGIYYPEA